MEEKTTDAPRTMLPFEIFERDIITEALDAYWSWMRDILYDDPEARADFERQFGVNYQVGLMAVSGMVRERMFQGSQPRCVILDSLRTMCAKVLAEVIPPVKESLTILSQANIEEISNQILEDHQKDREALQGLKSIEREPYSARTLPGPKPKPHVPAIDDRPAINLYLFKPHADNRLAVSQLLIHMLRQTEEPMTLDEMETIFRYLYPERKIKSSSLKTMARSAALKKLPNGYFTLDDEMREIFEGDPTTPELNEEPEEEEDDEDDDEDDERTPDSGGMYVDEGDDPPSRITAETEAPFRIGVDYVTPVPAVRRAEEEPRVGGAYDLNGGVSNISPVVTNFEDAQPAKLGSTAIRCNQCEEKVFPKDLGEHKRTKHPIVLRSKEVRRR